MYKQLRLHILAFFLIYAIYIPISQRFDLSVSMVLLCPLGLFYLINKNLKRINYEYSIYILFTVVMLIPILYSSQISQGLLYFVKNVMSITYMSVGLHYSKMKKNIGILKELLIFSIPLCLVNILFIISPELENLFINGKFATILVAPTGLQNWQGTNMTDPFKAGTIFTNTNNASAFFFLLLSISLVFLFYKKKKQNYLCTIIIFAALIATGSRTSYLAIIIIFFMLLFVRNRQMLNKVKKYLFISITIISAITVILINSNSGLIDVTLRVIERLSFNIIRQDPRVVLWGYALKHLSVIGYGYGGWEKIVMGLPLYFQNFPPHNHLLVLSFIGGIIPVVVYLFFWLHLVKKGIKAYKNDNSPYGMLLFFLSVSIIVHGMFDNYFLNQTNIMQLTYFLIGYCVNKINQKEVII